jgi:hypothetical protein
MTSVFQSLERDSTTQHQVADQLRVRTRRPGGRQGVRRVSPIAAQPVGVTRSSRDTFDGERLIAAALADRLTPSPAKRDLFALRQRQSAALQATTAAQPHPTRRDQPQAPCLRRWRGEFITDASGLWPRIEPLDFKSA